MDKRIIFVHGLGGNKDTFGKIPNFIEEDKSLNFTNHFFEYPTPLFGIKLSYFFQKKYQGIEDLAKSLKTFIDVEHSDADEITLVGHSLGGLIIKQYLVDVVLSREKLKIKNVIFYAVPSDGSDLARLSNSISFLRNPQAWQLCPNSEYLLKINEQWHKADLEESINFKVVVAGNDKIVTIKSAEGQFKAKNIEQITGVGHTDICNKAEVTGLPYTILRKVLLKKKILTDLKGIYGFDNFEDWQSVKERIFKFEMDDQRQAIFESIINELPTKQSSIRIRGLSGLGKTRLVFEAVLAAGEEIQNKVAYCDASVDSNNALRILKHAVSDEYEGVLIVDNCEPDLHAALTREALKVGSNIVLITIDFNLENQPSTNGKEFLIKQLDNSKIKAMLEPEFGAKIEDLDRIIEFAQGFPMMAVLISKARLANEKDVGKLTDDRLAKKLLVPLKNNQEKILKASSLFNRFGSEEDVSNQYKFIANNIANVSEEDFYSCLRAFKERGLIDQRGRYSQLVPMPLAIRLAAEWWQETDPQIQLKILELIPDTLTEQFCKQVTKLSFLPEVQKFSEKLCGVQAPFGQAEVILSKKGSQLFRAFVEVNPKATSSTLYRILTKLNHAELLKISDDTRRNLIFGLEMLAFHSELFEEAAWCLLLLASAENESWSNNSSGVFTQLFCVSLPGTEADFPKRMTVLKSALELNDTEIDRLVISAINNAISYHSSRVKGAEFQGNRPPLRDYKAKVWQEIFDYWQECFDILIALIEKKNKNSDEVLYTIGQSIRTMTIHGRIEMLDDAISKVIKINGVYWPSALESIKISLEHDSDSMPAKAKEALNRWLELLSPDRASLEEKLKIVVVNPPWEHHKNDAGNYVDIAAQKADALAKELCGKVQLSDDNIRMLLTGDQKQSFIFGQKWAEYTSDRSNVIDKVISLIKEIEKPNFNFLLGLLEGTYQKSKSRWDYYLNEFATKNDLVQVYPYAIRTGLIEPMHLEVLLKLIKSGSISPYLTSSLGNGGLLSHLEPEHVSSFCLKLSELDSVSSWCALDVMFMYCYSTKSFDQNKEALKKLVLTVPLVDCSAESSMRTYHWKEVIEKFISEDDFDFSCAVINQIINAATKELNFGDIHHYIRPVVTEIIKTFKEKIWPIIGDSIISLKPNFHFQTLTNILEKENLSSSESPSPLMFVPIKILIEWAKKELDFAPIFLARTINVFENNKDNNKKPTELFISLLENFGNINDVQSELFSNLGSRSWSGSLIPYLLDEKNALEPLLSHKNKNVKHWTKKYIEYIDSTIEREKLRDDEHSVGIY